MKRRSLEIFENGSGEGEQFRLQLILSDIGTDDLILHFAPLEEEQQRVREYIKWIAPSLLTLQHLDKAIRGRLENNLHVQAISIEHHRHLYPAILDQKLLSCQV